MPLPSPCKYIPLGIITSEVGKTDLSFPFPHNTAARMRTMLKKMAEGSQLL